MSAIIFLQVACYLSLLAFLVALVARAVKYATMPVHLRWELYPVAHESARPYGGSYLEELDWWSKARRKSHVGELKFMAGELLLFKQYYRLNKPYWYAVYPFHMGIFCLLAGLPCFLLVH